MDERALAPLKRAVQTLSSVLHSAQSGCNVVSHEESCFPKVSIKSARLESARGPRRPRKPCSSSSDLPFPLSRGPLGIANAVGIGHQKFEMQRGFRLSATPLKIKPLEFVTGYGKQRPERYRRTCTRLQIACAANVNSRRLCRLSTAATDVVSFKGPRSVRRGQ